VDANRALDLTDVGEHTEVTVRFGHVAQAPPLATALDALEGASVALASLPEGIAPDRLHHVILSAFHQLMGASFDAEAAGATLEQRRDRSRAARDFAARHSPTCAHAQAWPYGYPGDFRIVERMLDDVSPGEPGSLGHEFEKAVLGLPIVVQHRLKVRWQSELVRRRLAGRQSLRVLSIGCGGARDLALLDADELSRLTVVLCDFDGAALELASSRLSDRVAGLECLLGNALRRVAHLRRAQAFDVILIGGLLDYLTDKAAKTLLRLAVDVLAPGGTLGCTNIARGNPWRPVMELLNDWCLIERTGSDMAALLSAFGGNALVTSDPTRLTWLARGVRG
jgi:SAM-dependent methyltransferase